MRLLCNEWPPGTGKKSIHNLHDSEKLIQKNAASGTAGGVG